MIAPPASAALGAETFAPRAVTSPRRFAYVGTGGRVRMFLDPVAGRYATDAQIVALCDSSLVQAPQHRDRLITRIGYPQVPVYAAADFARMIRETFPHTVIVCTVDSEYDRYIIEALYLGCDVVTEKPMTTDAVKCRAILQAVRETGRKVRVAFNSVDSQVDAPFRFGKRVAR